MLWIVPIIFTCAVVWAFANWYARRRFIQNIQSKCVFITGCDSGFGYHTAITLWQAGVHVYAGCYTTAGAEKLLKDSQSNITTLQVDVTDRDSLIRAKARIENDLKTSKKELWGLINNAGILRGIVFHVASCEDFKSSMDVNYFGVINVTEIFLPFIKKSKGRIVNVISILSRCSGLMEPYVASKFALGVYNDGLRRCLKDYGVHVVAIEPGFHPTAMMTAQAFSSELDRNWNELPVHLQQEYGPQFRKSVRSDILTALVNPPLSCFNEVKNVSGAIYRALFSERPQTRYVVGFDAYLLYRFGPFVPDFLMDIAVRWYLSIYNVVKVQQDRLNGGRVA